MPLAVDIAFGRDPEARLSFREGGRRAAEWIREDDFDARQSAGAIELGAVLEDSRSSFGNTRFRNAPIATLEVAIRLSRSFMASALGRGLFDVFLDPDTQRLELRETLPEPTPLGRDIRIDRAGHGVVQLCAIVAPILLTAGRLVAIESPKHTCMLRLLRPWRERPTVRCEPRSGRSGRHGRA